MLTWIAAWLLSAAAPAPTVDPAWLSLTDCPHEPGCPALVLAAETELDNASDHPRLSVRRAVKLFTQDGIDRHADVDLIELSADYDIANVTGRTILPDGTTIPLSPEQLQLKKGIEIGGESARRRSARFPGVVPGAIVEISYDEMSRRPTTFSGYEWRLQEELPVLAARLRLRQGAWPMQWSQTGIEAVAVTHSSPARNVDEFVATRVPSVPIEPMSPPPEALRARLVFFIPVTQVDWLGQLAGRLAGRAGRFVEPSAVVTAKVKDVVAPEAPPLEKARALYRFVQERIGTEEKRLEETATEKVGEAVDAGGVMKRGYGDDEERVLLFVAMARAAGLETALLDVVTRTTGGLDHRTPDESMFDALAAAVRTGEGWTFYDPAVRFCPFAMVSPEKESDAPNALLVKPDKDRGFARKIYLSQREGTVYEPAPYSVVTIPASRAARNVLTREARVTLTPEGGALLEVTEEGTGLVDLDLKRELGGAGAKDREAAIRRRAGEIAAGAELIDFSFEDLEALDKPARIRYRVSVAAAGSGASDRLVVPASVLNLGRPNPFGAASRRAPVSFLHTQKTRDKILIKAPAGYEAVDLPDRLLVQEGPLTLATFFSRDMDAVVFTRHLEVDTLSWPATDYARLRAFFEKVREADEQVALFKKSDGS